MSNMILLSTYVNSCICSQYQSVYLATQNVHVVIHHEYLYMLIPYRVHIKRPCMGGEPYDAAEEGGGCLIRNLR